MATSTMFKVHEHSENVSTSAFALMDVPPTDASIERAAWEYILPVRDLKTTGDLEWYVNSDVNYTDTSQSYFEFGVKVFKTTGESLGDADAPVVWLGDNFMHSLFDKITVSLGANNVEYASYYPYHAYIENLFNYGKDVKEMTLAASSGWFSDALTGTDTVTGEDDAVNVRKSKVASQKLLSYYTTIRMSMLSLQRYMYPNMPLRLKFTHTDPKFCLMAANDNPAGGARVEIMSARLLGLPRTRKSWYC